MSDGRWKDSCRRYGILGGQLGHCPLQFGRSFGHLRLKLVPGSADVLLGPASFMNQVGAAEGSGCMIGSYCEQHPVSFSWEVAALAADSYQASVGVEPDRNNNAAERLQSFVKCDCIWNDLLAQRTVETGELGLQPVQECPGRASTRNVDRYL